MPNFSFEDTVSCSNGYISEAVGWLSFTDSPDYFNSCADISSGFNVPNTGLGYQLAFDGSAYGGLLNYGVNTTPQREYMGTQLSSPLVIGQKYYVSFMASLADGAGANGWSNKLGAKFTTFTYSSSDGDTFLMSNSAHIYSDSILKDTVNWVQIKGAFIADSAYQYIVIGNFFDDFNTDTLNCLSASYVFIDMVCVSTDSLMCSTPLSIDSYNQFPKMSIYPNPATDFLNIQNSLNAPFNLTVFNSLGQQLYMEQNITSNNLQLDVSSCNTGLLFIKITSQNNQYIYKLLKQ